jgi:hypothetical protein
MSNQEILKNHSGETPVQESYKGRIIYDENGKIERWVPGRPPFIFVPEIHNLSGKEIPPEIRESVFLFMEELGENLAGQGCQVLTEPVTDFPKENGMIINPVYLGDLNEALFKGLRGEMRDLKACVQKNLPEICPPLAREVGGKFGVGLHPNFTNLIIIGNGEIFKELEGEPLKTFARALMAKTGAWKVIILPFSENNLGIPILATMEGGQPRVKDLENLAYRLRVLASVEKVGGFELVEGISIKGDDWKTSQTLENLIAFGRYLGERRLLPPPAEIDRLVKDIKLAKLVERLTGFTRQQEGAYALWTPEFNFGQSDLGDGIMVVSRTGSDNGMTALKTNPDASCFVPGVPLMGNGMYGKIKVDGVDTGKPSVEAEEFTLPLAKLDKIKMSYQGKKIEGPPIIGIVHLHAGVLGIKEEAPINHLVTDIERFPPVGCGVDAMAAMSEYYMRKAVEAWQESGYKVRMVAYYVPNHGTNFFIFPEFDGKNFRYPDDPFSFFKQAVDQGMIDLTDNVPQV